tara:strand:- start:86 stop:1117 length:1032 start_codon:yes stop_codon:yes gene_type:complete
MKKINWGIIGLGKIAEKFADGFNFSEKANLLSVSSLSEAKLKEFKKKYSLNGEYCFNNYQDLINCKDVDIVYIALPNSMHFKWILKCLENHKNTLVEKPAVMNLYEINEIKELLKKRNIFFSEAFMYRYSPHFIKLIDLIKNNTIGKLSSIESTFGINVYDSKKIFGITIKKPDLNNRLFNKKLGGGAILDLGCYPVSLCTYIYSLISSMNSSGIKLEKVEKNFCPSGVETSAYAEMHFDNYFKCKISASLEKNLGQKTKIFGNKGTIILDSTWSPKKSCKIEILSEKKNIFNITLNENIYSYEINQISNHLLENKTYPEFPSININEIINNTNILHSWLNYN